MGLTYFDQFSIGQMTSVGALKSTQHSIREVKKFYKTFTGTSVYMYIDAMCAPLTNT